jgi:hypothetical protein
MHKLLHLLLTISCLSSTYAQLPVFTLTPKSQVKHPPKVSVNPLHVSLDGTKNQFYFGARTSITLKSSMSVPVPQGATVQAWLSDLSAGTVARLAANQFMPDMDLCEQLAQLDPIRRRELQLPAACPIPARRTFVVDQVLDAAFWAGVQEYKSYVVGASGVLELRFWDKAPCTVCWQKPKLLLGVSIPFDILDSNVAKSTQTTGGKTEKKLTMKKNNEL